MKEIELNISQELEYLESFGIELSKLEDEPAPLGSIKLVIEKLNLNPSEDIKEISMMSYNANDSIIYINEKHNTDSFKINILAHKDTIKQDYDNSRIKQIPSEFQYTQHQNLIELKDIKHISTMDTKGNKIEEDTKFLLFLEPYHNGKEFGKFYESKKNNIPIPEDEAKELDFLKARMFIPTPQKIKELQLEFSA